ncbi:MAG: TMEM175 family protein [Vicingaceae bacterium]
MFRDLLNKTHSTSKYGFRYRGMEASRIENLTDAVFAFAITLLVIASEVPSSYVELQASMYDFIGFIFCALLIFGIWNNHYNFFRHYGMQDKLTKSLNFIFIFVLLFYIYPLKYLFSYLGTAILISLLQALNYTSPAMRLSIEKVRMANMSSEQWTDLMVRFGLGLFFLYLILFIMHRNALKKKTELKLNPLEVYETKNFMTSYIFLVCVTILSMTIVLLGGGAFAPHAGFVYCCIPVLLPLFRKYQVKNIQNKYQEYFP